jgi:nitrate reductase cytochrome c-type subunit
MQRTIRLASVALVAALALVATPGVAQALTTNAYGRTYMGRGCWDPGVGDRLGCHTTGSFKASIVPTTTLHSQFVQPPTNPGVLGVTTATANWPSPTVGAAIRIFPSNIAFVIAAGDHNEHRFILQPGSAITPGYSTFSTVPTPTGAPDDLAYLKNSTVMSTNGVWAWNVAGAATLQGYFQGCGGCHNTGMTRSTNATYTLADGVAQAGRSTPNTFTEMSIQCEYCHGTGKTATGDADHGGVGVVGWNENGDRKILDSQVCGQCHVTGSSVETNYAGTGRFSSPVGYTVDETLSAYFNIESTISTLGSFVVGTSKFYPDGHNQQMTHPYYNEWLKSGHSSKLTSPANFVLTAAKGNTKCLRCHTGEGFLDYIGASVVPPSFEATLSQDASGTWTSNARYSQECVVCHTPHDRTNGLGERRNPRTGANVGCADCHNWRFETLDSTITAELARPVPEFRSGDVQVRHPQREMREGHGLLDVAATPEWMPGAECQSCHMPDTWRGGSGRPSHRFTPMTPDVATAYQVKAFGDSCTPCHTSKTRDELAASRAAWATRFNAAAAEATAALEAGYARAAASPSDLKWTLYKKAQLNTTYILNDGSRGNHNLPYALAGWAKVKEMSEAIGGSIGTGVSAGTINAGQTVYIAGTVRKGTGAAAGDTTVTIEQLPAGAANWTTLTAVRTAADGSYAIAVKPSKNTRYQAVWKVTATERIAAATSVAVRTSTTMRTSAYTVAAGSYFTVSGAVAPSPGGSVTLQYKAASSGTWRWLTARPLSGSGGYGYSLRLGRGAWHIRAVTPASASYLGSTSAPVAVTVR